MRHRLHYAAPAGHFNEALPVGNGRLGAMFYGSVEMERLHLNEDSLWSGTGPAPVPPQAREALPEIRRLLFAGQLREAHELAIRTLPGRFTEAYQPVGDLILEFIGGAGEVTEYRREFDLRRAIGTTSFLRDGVRHCREVLASHPAGVIAFRWAVNQPGALACRLRIECPHPHRINADGSGLRLFGMAPSRVEWFRTNEGEGISYDERPGHGGMEFVLGVAVFAPGASVAVRAGTLEVTGASELVLVLDVRTSFTGNAIEHIVAENLARAHKEGWPSLVESHVADHQRLFDRVQLRLGEDDADGLPTPERLARRAAGGIDPSLEALLFDYGRYLLIASSRPGSQPANLQGLWNRDRQPPWWSNYTLNINTAMNYWPTEICALPELQEPLFDYIDRLRVQGEIVAREMYGCGGWCAHHQTDLWASATPVGFTSGEPNEGASRYALWPMGAAWLVRHFWEHFLHSGDRGFLRERAWPAMSGAAAFLLDFLVERPDGRLTTAPSTSPENSFRAEGFRAAIATGSTMDLSIIRDLFSNCLAAEKHLGGVDPVLVGKLRAALDRLPPLTVTDSGRIPEWDQDYREWEPEHRHVSHLYGLHPAFEIDPDRTPTLANAARLTLDARTDNGTGWSLAWKINFWARLRDAGRAHALIERFFHVVPAVQIGLDHPGGLYPNLLCAHPPFQIDGNFGYTAGVAEMLLQSRCPAGDGAETEIHLLPALPAAWGNGEVTGLRARGGVTVDMRWLGGALTEVRLTSRMTQEIVVRLSNQLMKMAVPGGETVVLNGGFELQSIRGSRGA